MKYSIVIASYCSELFLERTLDELEAAMAGFGYTDYEVVVVNDGSPDRSWENMRRLTQSRPWLLCVDLAKNAGQHNAILTALRFVTGDIIINMDDDLQTHPSQIQKLVNKLDEGYDVVYAAYGDEQSRGLKKVFSRLHNKVARKLLDGRKDLTTSSFWAIRAFVADRVVAFESDRCNMQSLFVRTTGRITNVQVQHYPRSSGQSGYTFKKSLKLWSSILSFSEYPPVALIKMAAMAFCAGSLLFLFYLILDMSLAWGHLAYVFLLYFIWSCFLALVTLMGYTLIFVMRTLKIVMANPQSVVRSIACADRRHVRAQLARAYRGSELWLEHTEVCEGASGSESDHEQVRGSDA